MKIGDLQKAQELQAKLLKVEGLRKKVAGSKDGAEFSLSFAQQGIPLSKDLKKSLKTMALETIDAEIASVKAELKKIGVTA